MNTTADQARIRQAVIENRNAELLRELQHAHQIIRNALNLMTTDQKFDWGAANTRDGVDGDGITRFHEREAVLVRAGRSAA